MRVHKEEEGKQVLQFQIGLGTAVIKVHMGLLALSPIPLQNCIVYVKVFDELIPVLVSERLEAIEDIVKHRQRKEPRS